MDHKVGSRRLQMLCNLWEVSPVGFIDTEHGRIFIAEGWQTKRPHFEGNVAGDFGAGWTVVAAVEHRGPGICMPIYLKSTATPEQRRAAAEDWGRRFLEAYHRSNAA